MKKKKVFVFAYTNFNLGDDLFIHQLVKRYPNVKFIMILHKKYYNVFKSFNYNNIKVYCTDSLLFRILNKFELLRKYKEHIILSTDYGVYIGGSIFMEGESQESDKKRLEKLYPTKRLMIIGCNFGPYRHEAYLKNIKLALSKMLDVCFRDKYSFNLLTDNKTNIRYAPDILFGIQIPQTTITPKKESVFYSVIDCNSKTEGSISLAEYENEYINLITEGVEESIDKNYRIVLCSFCNNQNDNVAIKRIIKRIPVSKRGYIDVLEYDGFNYMNIIQEMQNAELVVASRFHAAVLGFTLETPVLPVVYSKKTINVLKDIGFLNHYINIKEIKSEDYHIIKQPNNYITKYKYITNISEIRNQSLGHFLVADSLFSEK